ncbi:MAG: ABC transporter ATP-binding protein [Fibrobacter sp.]|nr:ABC transporter ATP-binding protein [Fibrobacter sp.]
MSSNDHIIECRGVTFAYGSNLVVKNATFSVCRGDFLGIIGPNGGGKTTLLRLILGVLKPLNGSIILLGGPPVKTRIRAGYIPQETNLNKGFPISVHDVVLMGLTRSRGLGHLFSKEDKKKTDSILEQFDLLSFKNEGISNLSGGQRQKVLLARALVSRPEILFLDEPTSSVDAAGADEIYDYLKKVNAEGTTVVLVTHNMGIISRYIKSVACVNKDLFFHPDGKLDEQTLSRTFGCEIDLIAHGVPHRVFHSHEGKPQ